MGFPTSENEFGTDCPVGCWASGKTPDKIFVSFTGIKNGELWTPAANFPPYPFVQMDQVSSVAWQYVSGPWTYDLTFNASYTEFKITHSTYGQVFYAKPVSSCVFQFASELVTEEGEIWYDGIAQIGWSPDTDDASIRRMMSIVNILPDSKTYAEFWRFAPDVMVDLVARKIDATKVYIKFDYS